MIKFPEQEAHHERMVAFPYRASELELLSMQGSPLIMICINPVAASYTKAVCTIERACQSDA